MSRIAVILLAATCTCWRQITRGPRSRPCRTGPSCASTNKGVRDPITATLADATEERIVVVAKNKQTTIAREDIERIDARPVEPKKKPEAGATTQTTADPDLAPRLGAGPPMSTTSTSSGMSFGGNKPDFKTIYTKPPAAPKN